MSRATNGACHWRKRFPRVSGDEPTVTVKRQEHEGFSPRERG